ncbi:lipid A biosynthesis (KDO)2-(lauroyl)-lipid IVA acyltransferase [Marinilabiliaceae bacterium JC040]|nr:lipid A biosynthesis (KDO)2-(lauroyl)-lipid IVA acyltransferase [Marinilabiliaceae bacterium JC040]
MQEKERGWQGKTGGGNFGQKFLISLFKYVDIRFGYFLVYMVVPFYIILGIKRSKWTYIYFRKRLNYGVIKSLLSVYKNYCLFGQMMLDRFLLYTNSFDKVKCDIIGHEHILKRLSCKNGFMSVSSHVGNFEISGYLNSQDLKRINVVVYGGESETIMSNRRKVLNKNNIDLISVDNKMSHIFRINEVINNGEILYLSGDRNAGLGKIEDRMFLGKKTKFPIGAYKIALRYGLDILAMHVVKTSWNKYKIYVNPIYIKEEDTLEEPESRKIDRMLDNYINELEGILSKYPLQWFNFYNFWND